MHIPNPHSKFGPMVDRANTLPTELLTALLRKSVNGVFVVLSRKDETKTELFPLVNIYITYLHVHMIGIYLQHDLVLTVVL